MAGQASEKPRVGIYDLKTKRTVFIAPRNKVDDYLTNIAWSPDDKFLVVVEINREQNHLWLNVYDAESGEFVKTLLEEKNEKWVEPENPVFFPTKSNNDFVWISQKDGFNNLYYYDWNGKLKLQLTKNKFVLKNIVSTINKGNEIVFTATGTSPLDFKYFAVSLKGKQREITSQSGTHSLSIGLDGKYFFDEYSSHSIPSISQILDANGKVLKELVKGQNKLSDFAIGETEISQIKANDGTILYTRLIKPSHFDPSKKYPVMVYVYGGPHAQMIQNEWLDGSNLWMHWMAEKGYLVYTVDNRGSANRGFEFESVIHRQLGTVEMEDQLAGVKYLKSLNFVDSNRLAIHGWSFGGFMTTSMMLRNPGVFKVGVAGGPVTDWKFYEIMYGERYMDMPFENPKGYEKASLLNYTKNLKGDLMLIHGTADDVVVMQHNYALIKKFVEAGVQVDFFPYPMHKHNVMGKDRVHLMEKVLTYILENNN
jgi:dipeptidyl-peptidase-4